MGKKSMSRLLAVMVALVMIFTCSASVFAAGTASPKAGKVTSVATEGKSGGKSFTVSWKKTGNADYYIVKWGSKTKKVTGTSTTIKTSVGTRYTITVTPYLKNGKKGTAKSATKRWAKATTITSASKDKKGKITLKWKKAKNATKYYIYMYKNSKWTKVATATGTSKTVTCKKGSHKFKVVPVRGQYIGIRSGAKTGKAK